VRLEEAAELGQIFEVQTTYGTGKTKLQEFMDAGDFSVFQPTINGLPMMQLAEQTVDFMFLKDNGIYTFKAQMLKNYEVEGLKLCRFKLIGEVNRCQRRRAFRLPIVLKVELEYYEDAPEAGQEPKVTTLHGKTAVISEKSIQMITKIPFTEKMRVTIKLHLNPLHVLHLTAEVLRCSDLEQKYTAYDVVFVFVDCLEKDITMLRRFIIQQQAKQCRDRK